MLPTRWPVRLASLSPTGVGTLHRCRVMTRHRWSLKTFDRGGVHSRHARCGLKARATVGAVALTRVCDADTARCSTRNPLSGWKRADRG